MAGASEKIKAFLVAAAKGDEVAVQRGIDSGLLHSTGVGPPFARSAQSVRTGWSALHGAAWGGRPEIVKLLVDAGANASRADRNGSSPLLLAVEQQNAETVELLLQLGATTETADNAGRSPVHVAAEKENVQILKMLVKAGATTEAKDKLGRTPLLLAVDQGKAETVQMLLEVGARSGSVDKFGRTPLLLAVDKKNTEIVRLLLASGSNTRAVDDYGRTPLHVAVDEFWNPSMEIVNLLLDAGADPRVMDNRGRAARDIARDRGHTKICTLLEGAEEEWSRIRAFILQVSAEGTELTFRTLSGSVAARVSWPSENLVQDLPFAVLKAIRSSGLEMATQPLWPASLRFVLPNCTVLDTSPGAGTVYEQLLAT